MFSVLEIVLISVVSAGGIFAGVKFAFRVDTEIEDRRRLAGQLAIILSKYGLKRIPAFLLDYSVGDYSGLLVKLRSIVDLFLDGEEAVVKEFNEVFERCLTSKLKSKEGRAYVVARLADADSVVTKS